MQEAVGILVQVDFAITDFTSPAYLRLRLKRPLSKFAITDFTSPAYLRLRLKRPLSKSHLGDGFALRCFQRLS